MWVRREPPKDARVEAPPTDGEEQCVTGAARQRGPRVAEVARDDERRLFAERDDALLATLPADVNALLVDVDIREVEGDHLRAPEATRVRELEEGVVPEAERRVVVVRVDERLDLLEARCVRQAASRSGGDAPSVGTRSGPRA